MKNSMVSILALSLAACADSILPSDAASETTGETTGETGGEPAIVLDRIEGKYGAICGLRADASSVCWGLIADPASEGWLEPPYLPFEHLEIVGTACGIHDGTVYCWGPSYGIGMLGSGLPEDEIEFEQALERGGVAIGEPGERVVALGSGIETDVIDAQLCALTDAGHVYCWGSMASEGYPGFQPIGDDETPADVGPIELGEPAVAIAVGGQGVCATLASGGVRCWGSHRLTGLEPTPLGEDIVPADNPILDLGGPIHAVSISFAHACAIVGDGEVKCWGYFASSGELGYPGVVESLPTASLDPVEIGGKAVEIVAGSDSSCARLESGEVVCWGTGEYGRTGHPWQATCDTVVGTNVFFDCDDDPSCCIGDDETPASVGPVDLPGPAVDLASTSTAWCALLEGGAVHCWGSGVLGSLGDGLTPVCIQPDLVDMQCGLDPRCCIGDDETPAEAARPVVFD